MAVQSSTSGQGNQDTGCGRYTDKCCAVAFHWQIGLGRLSESGRISEAVYQETFSTK